MSTFVMHNTDRSIGCNIVDPVCDKGEMYTKEVYLRNLAHYRHYGIRHIEFSHVTVIDVADANEIREYMQAIGLVPWSIHSEHLNDSTEAGLQAYLKEQIHCCDVAKALGTKVVVCHLPNINPHELDRDCDILNQLADITSERGLTLALEICQLPTAYHIEVIDQINRPDVGINVDTGHVFLFGGDPAQSIRDVGHRLVTTHLQDNFGENDDHQPPGMGYIDWRGVLQALVDIDYRGPLMVELTGEGVKERRTVPQLRQAPLEKEIILMQSYLTYLLKEMK
jgi:sugar phosphate isomerase/epimerase